MSVLWYSNFALWTRTEIFKVIEESLCTMDSCLAYAMTSINKTVKNKIDMIQGVKYTTQC